MFEQKDYELYQGNCLEKLQELIDQNIKVNSVICDIPFVLFSSQPFTSKLINSNINNFREEIIWLKNKPASGMQ